MEFKHYPYLDKDEFSEACHFMDRHYRQATLGPLRRRWKLRVNTALAAAFGDGDSSSYIQIIRPLEASLDHEGLSSEIDKFSFGNSAVDEDLDMLESEEADEVRGPACRRLSKDWALTHSSGGSEEGRALRYWPCGV